MHFIGITLLPGFKRYEVTPYLMKKGNMLALYQPTGKIGVDTNDSAVISDYILNFVGLPFTLTKPGFDLNWKFYVKAITSSAYNKTTLVFSKSYSLTATYEIKVRVDELNLELKKNITLFNSNEPSDLFI